MLPALLFGTLSVLAPVRLYDLGFGAVPVRVNLRSPKNPYSKD